MNFIESIVCKLSGEDYYNNWVTKYDELGKIIGDADIAAFVKEHSRFIDRVNPTKMVFMAKVAEDMLKGTMEIPDGKWRFK